ncbi:Alpha/Beta hydrolase protein [Hysterangium stoloniferum]|nr:Alpha/Beta hydrolase protein [Hysterangium stoloniferum]
MTYPSHPPPMPSEIHPDIGILPRSLDPLLPPPLSTPLPSLPSPKRDPSFTSSYTLTTHLYPSAFPHVPSTPLPRSSYSDVPGETKEQRLKRQESLLHELWEQSCAMVEGKITQSTNRPVLWNVVNRFVRNMVENYNGGVILFIAHANGFNKETWEPFLLELFSEIEGEGGVINEVWAFEAVQHGDSAIINDPVIGNVFDWADSVRDILNFLLYHLPSTLSSTVLPTHLPRVSEDIAERRKISGFENDRHRLVGIGHSLGGCSVLRAAIEYPVLFDSLVLVDPVLSPIASYIEQSTPPSFQLASGAIRRREAWSSRDEALSIFQKSPFFKAWHPDVLRKYVDYGLTPFPDGTVHLKMSGVQEAVVFLDTRVAYETWQLLKGLDPRIEIFFLFSETATMAVSGLAARETAWRRKENVSNVILPYGHLIPHEAPKELGLRVNFLHRREV